jgi:hypothetical protein
MNEKTLRPLAVKGRLPFGAVPLDPWRATQAEGGKNLYSGSSLIRIERNLIRTMIDDDWFRQEPRAHKLYDFMRSSLFDSQFRRMDKNSLLDVGRLDDCKDERVMHGIDGIATPAELFTLLVDYPEISSLELAKLSHPFDFPASDEMDREMDELMLRSGGDLLDSDPRYKMKRLHPDIPAAILLRKQDLMDFTTDDGTVRIVQRRGLLVFDGPGMEDELYFDRLLKNPKNMTALGAKTEAYISQPEELPYGWVQPQATSYYAKRLTPQPIQI